VDIESMILQQDVQKSAWKDWQHYYYYFKTAL